MKKKNKKKRIIYHKPPMKYNVALHKFEPDLPTVEKRNIKNQVQIIPLIIIIIGIIIVIGVILYTSQV